MVCTFAIVNLLLARMAFAWLERWLAQRRTREIMGLVFFLCILSLQLIGPLATYYGHKSKVETQLLGQELSKLQKPLPPGLAAAAIAGMDEGQHWTSLTCFLLLGLYGIAFLWLLNFRLRAEYRGENLNESSARKALAGNISCAPSRMEPAGIVRSCNCSLRKRVAISQPQRAHDVHAGGAVVHAAGLSKFGTERGSIQPRA